MAYQKQNWKNLPDQTTPLSAERLNHLETQYEEAVSEAKNYTESEVSDALQEAKDYTDTAIDNAPISSPNLVSRTPRPIFIAHRGSKNLFPEHSMYGYSRSFEAGFSPEADVQALGDGTLVCNHDSTTGRTLTGDNVSLNELDLEAWKKRRIKPPKREDRLLFGKMGSPVTFEEYLDRFGGRTLLFPEIKDEAITQDFLQALSARNLVNSVIVQSFHQGACEDAVEKGFEALLLVGTSHSSSVANNIKAAGINWVGVPKTTSKSDLEMYKSVGFEVAVYTVNSVSEADKFLEWGADAIFSDDPWLVSKSSSPGGALRMDSTGTPGITQVAEYSAGGIVGDPQVQVDGDILSFYMPGSQPGNVLNAVGLPGISLTRDPVGEVFIRQTVTSLASRTGSSAAWLWGVYYGTNPDMEAVSESSNDIFRLAFLRRDGRMHVYEKTSPSGSTQLLDTQSAPSEWPSLATSDRITLEITSVFSKDNVYFYVETPGLNRGFNVGTSSWEGVEDLFLTVGVRGTNATLDSLDISFPISED